MTPHRTLVRTLPASAADITKYLGPGGKPEIAQQMANHGRAYTTGTYGRRSDQVKLDEVESIAI